MESSLLWTPDWKWIVIHVQHYRNDDEKEVQYSYFAAEGFKHFNQLLSFKLNRIFVSAQIKLNLPKEQFANPIMQYN